MARLREALEGKFREPGLKAQVAEDTKVLPDGKHKLRCDGRGLYIRIAPPNGASWVFRYMVGRRSRTMGLGRYPDLALAEAREEALSMRRLLLAGSDPIEARKLEKQEKRETADRAKTLKECADTYISAHAKGWKHEKTAGQWRATFASYVYPILGEDKGVAEVGTDDVLKVLNQPVTVDGEVGTLWTSKNPTATRVRERIEAVLDNARFHNLRTGENPARWKGHLSHSLPKPSRVAEVEHFPALPYVKIGEFMSDLRASEALSAKALDFLILTAVRSHVVAGAPWSEIDLTAKEWFIPAVRMKGAKGASLDHRVPLTDAAIAILRSVMALAPQKDGKPDPKALIFPGRDGEPMSDATMRKMCKGLGYTNERGELVVPHGFRSSFRTWGQETGVEEEAVLELALAHAQKGVVPSYARGEMFDRRRKVMEKWADECARSAKGLEDLLA